MFDHTSEQQRDASGMRLRSAHTGTGAARPASRFSHPRPGRACNIGSEKSSASNVAPR